MRVPIALLGLIAAIAMTAVVRFIFAVPSGMWSNLFEDIGLFEGFVPKGVQEEEEFAYDCHGRQHYDGAGCINLSVLEENRRLWKRHTDWN